MRKFYICLFYILIFSNLYSQDAVQLQEVLISKNLKKPKLKKIKVGTDRPIYMSSYLFFEEDIVFYLTDNLPMGYIQDITVFFAQMIAKSYQGDYKTYKTEKTEFEIIVYDVEDDYAVGKKINSEPIYVLLEESNNDKIRKVELNFGQYNFKANRFYVCLKKITETTCRDCYYHAPVLYRTEDGYHYITDKQKEIYKNPQNCPDCFGLKMIVKTLTQDY